MSVRCGHIMRHEDVHGVSGTGDKLADVFEASDGTTVVVWLGPDGSANVYKSIKNVVNVHGHGGKTEVIWDWEQQQEPDPMDKILNKGQEPLLTEEEVEQIADAASSEAAAQVASKIVEKMAERAAETNGNSKPQPTATKKKTSSKKSPSKKG